MIKTPGDIARAALRLEDPGPRLEELGRLYELYHAAHEEKLKEAQA